MQPLKWDKRSRLSVPQCWGVYSLPTIYKSSYRQCFFYRNIRRCALLLVLKIYGENLNHKFLKIWRELRRFCMAITVYYGHNVIVCVKKINLVVTLWKNCESISTKKEKMWNGTFQKFIFLKSSLNWKIEIEDYNVKFECVL